MSSINPGHSQVPIAGSLAGISSSGKNSTSEKTPNADGGAAKVVERANADAGGLAGSEKTADRDADGRQFDDQSEDAPSASGRTTPEQPSAPPRSKDPQRLRGNQIDLDA